MPIAAGRVEHRRAAVARVLQHCASVCTCGPDRNSFATYARNRGVASKRRHRNNAAAMEFRGICWRPWPHGRGSKWSMCAQAGRVLELLARSEKYSRRMAENRGTFWNRLQREVTRRELTEG